MRARDGDLGVICVEVRVTLGLVLYKRSWVRCLMYIISMNSPSKRHLNKYMHRETKNGAISQNVNSKFL